MENNKENISRDQQKPPLALSLSLSFQTQQPPPPRTLPPLTLQTEQKVDREVPRHLLDQMLNISDLKHHPFPIYRVKKIMKSDLDVTMVAAEAPILLGKACEMFIADLTHGAWRNAREKKRNMIEKSDVINALASHEPCDFLLDLFRKEELVKPEAVAPSDAIDLTNMMQQCDYVMGVPAYYPLLPGLVIGTPVVYPAWPRILPQAMDGGGRADEAGPSGTANKCGN